MAHAVIEEPAVHMGLPVSNGKLAMWLFLVTEIMFFTGIIGTYIVLRNGAPSKSEPWPTPHQVHLVEWIGALNTFVLICSSLTVVLAHSALGRGDVRAATGYMGVTLALGCLFLGIKAYEYQQKIKHDILPGHVFDRVDGARGSQYLAHVQAQLEKIDKEGAESSSKFPGQAAAECHSLLRDMIPVEKRQTVNGTEVVTFSRVLSAREIGERVGEIHERYPDLELSPIIPWGNLWASCYFAMTGFHALHVLGGLVIFTVILLMAWAGRFGPRHESLVELTGLYWHFVDIVWIFLFPLLYLV